MPNRRAGAYVFVCVRMHVRERAFVHTRALCVHASSGVGAVSQA